MALGRLAHRALVEGAEQPVVRHRVDAASIVAVLVALREPGSRCGALVIDSMPPATTMSNSPAADQLVGQRDRVEPGQADLVDRQRRHRHRDAGLDRGLAGGDLAGAGLQHLAHDHVVDRVAGDAGARQRGLDGEAAEVDAPEKSASEPSSLPMGVRAPRRSPNLAWLTRYGA